MEKNKFKFLEDCIDFFNDLDDCEIEKLRKICAEEMQKLYRNGI